MRHRFFFAFLSLWLAGALNAPAWPEPVYLEDQPTSLVYPPFFHTPLGIHRGTPELLALFAGHRTRFDRPEGLACNTLLSEIHAKRAEPEFCLTVVGANTGQGHLIYNPTLSSLEILGDARNRPGLFANPTGVCLTTRGTVWVADPSQRQVLRCVTRNNRLEPAAPLPPPPGGWQAPWGVAADSEDHLYITDAAADRIYHYDAEGRFLAALGPELGPGLRLHEPRAIAVADPKETWNFYRDHYLFLVDQGGSRLLRCAPDGRFPQAALAAAAVPQANSPAAFAWLALDYYENVWVTDPSQSRIHKFNRHLAYLDSFGRPGAGDGCFDRPSGIAIFRHFGQVFVAEARGAHYFWVAADIRDPRLAWENSGLLRASFFLTEPASVTLKIAKAGKGMATVYVHPWQDSGARSILAYAGNAPAGAEVWLIAEATYSSARYFAKRVRLTVPARP